MPQQQSYTYKQAAAHLHLQEQYVRQLVRRGRIKIVGREGVHQRVLLDGNDVERYNQTRGRTAHSDYARYSLRLRRSVVDRINNLSGDQASISINDIFHIREAIAQAALETEQRLKQQASARVLRSEVRKKEDALAKLGDMWDDEQW